VKTQGTSNTLIVALYVDDLCYIDNNEKVIANFKKDMMKRYEMNDIGLLYDFLVMEIC